MLRPAPGARGFRYSPAAVFGRHWPPKRDSPMRNARANMRPGRPRTAHPATLTPSTSVANNHSAAAPPTPPPTAPACESCSSATRPSSAASGATNSPRPPLPEPTARENLDAHYTPSAIAEALLSPMRDLRPSLIADLAAGNGDLLLAAERVWPNATFVATDIDKRAIRRLSQLRSSWTVGRCDLRSSRSRASCRALDSLLHSACLMLLNPPFSCRGGTHFLVQTPNGPLRASTAMSFLLHAAAYVAPGGHIVSILPLGCLHNAKDAQAWTYLQSKYNVTVLQTYTKGAFPDSAASTALVHLSPSAHNTAITPADDSRTTPRDSFLRVSVIRGSCPIHRPRHEEDKPSLVHYTDIRNGVVTMNGRRGFGSFRCVDGPAILIPRVGRLTSGKIGLLKASHPVMLSDCVIALKPESLDDARILRDRLLANLEHLHAQYVGTGAPFITIRRLTATLQAIGVKVHESS